MEILATPGVQDPKMEVNPDWVDAPYEFVFLGLQPIQGLSPKMGIPIIFKRERHQ